MVLIGVTIHAAEFLEVHKSQPVLLYELVKGWVTGTEPELRTHPEGDAGHPTPLDPDPKKDRKRKDRDEDDEAPETPPTDPPPVPVQDPPPGPGTSGPYVV